MPYFFGIDFLATITFLFMTTIYYKILADINAPENSLTFAQIRSIIDPHAEDIVHKFYREMLGNSEAVTFLNNDMVKHRLRKAMVHWINIAFLYRDSEEEREEYINYQVSIGHIHARIDIPVGLVNYGMFFFKKHIVALLLDSKLDREELNKATLLTSQVLDCALGIMNQSFQGDLMVNEKDSESFKLQFTTHNLAFDCERLRTSLSDWMRDLLLTIQQERFEPAHFPTIRSSNFGLWVTHKAKLFLSNRSEYTNLIQLLDDSDEALMMLIKEYEDGGRRKEILKNLNGYISNAIWLLGDIAKEIIEKDNGRDSLTRLFNRRYLDTVLRHETECSLQNDLLYGLLTIDIDFFKKVNDTHGHDAGDKVLVQLADILTRHVRAGDFVFRLGGEEFLIVLGGISLPIISGVSEKIRNAVEMHDFIVNESQSIKVTVSIGTAIHDGHPDFNRTIKHSDLALYEAKNTGRNRICVAKVNPLTYVELASD